MWEEKRDMGPGLSGDQGGGRKEGGVQKQCGPGEDLSPLNLLPHLSNAVAVQVLAQPVEPMSAFSCPPPAAGQGGLGSPWKMPGRH